MTTVTRAAIVRCLGGALFGALTCGLLYVLATRDLAQLGHGVIVGGVVGAQIAGVFKELRDECAARAAQDRSQPAANTDGLANHFKEGMILTVTSAYAHMLPIGIVFLCTGSLGLIWVDSVSSSRPFDWFGLGDSLDSVFWAVGLFAASVVLASLFVVVSKTLIRVTSAAAQRVLRIPR